MRIRLQNRHIVPLVPFLRNMKLKGEQSRARSKFMNLVLEAYSALHDSELELLKEYAVLDEDGNPKFAEGGAFTLRDGNAQDYLIEHEKLFSEIAEIEGATYTANLSMMKQILTEYDGELSGDEAEMYDALMDAFEEESNDG